MLSRQRKSTQKLTAAAVCAALAAVLLLLGNLIDVLDLSLAALASLTVAFAVIELGKKYAWGIYAVVSAISLLLPVKTPGLIFALFCGYYPILKAIFEKHFSKPVAWIFKILLFAIGMSLALFLAFKLFTINVELPQWGYYLLPFSLGVFLLYDVALTRLITTYLFRWRGKFFH